MKKIFLIFGLIGSALGAFAQVGDDFPLIKGETVKDSIVEIPTDTKDKFTLVGMAYSKKSEESLSGWFEPAYQKFIQPKESEGAFSAFSYDVNIYFIPMFTGVNAAAEGTAKKQTIKNIDPRLHDYILFYKGKLKDYKDKLDFEKKDVAYFFVIDMEGKIVFATSGDYTEEKMDRIEEILDGE